MARAEKPKTQLSQRLIDIRKALGFETRKELADILGIKLTTLGSYERGDNEPDTKFYQTYSERFQVNLNWLISGIGPMFGTNNIPIKTENLHLQAETLRKLATIVHQCCNDEKIKIPVENVSVEALYLYSELMARASNALDQDEVNVLLPHLEFIMKRKLSEKKASN